MSKENKFKPKGGKLNGAFQNGKTDKMDTFKPSNARNRSNTSNSKNRRSKSNGFSAGNGASGIGYDVNWFAANTQMLNDCASLSFGNFTGTDVPEPYTPIPGVWAFDTLLTPGKSLGLGSPINIAARQVYSYIRHANSGSTNYDTPDLMLYLMAMDELYAALTYAQTTYGVISTYSYKNRYYPDAILRAMGWDFDDLLHNINEFRSWLNKISIKASTLAVPKTMTIFNRHQYMFSNIFKDSNTDKAGLYLYKPAGFRVYDETSDPRGGRLNFYALPKSHFITSSDDASVEKFGMCIEQFQKLVESMLDALIESQDINIMSGDILKAYGDNIWRMTTIDEDYSVVPTYSEFALAEIQNLRVLPRFLQLVPTDELRVGEYDISQNPGTNTLVFNPTFFFHDDLNDWSEGVRSNFLDEVFMDNTSTKMITLDVESPEPADVMVATRLLFSLDSDEARIDDEDYLTISLGCVGTEVILDSSIWGFDYSLGQRNFTHYRVQSALVLNTDDRGGLGSVSDISRFYKHPEIWILHSGDIDTGKCAPVAIGDVDNFTFISKHELNKLHECAILSEFDVPSIAG